MISLGEGRERDAFESQADDALECIFVVQDWGSRVDDLSVFRANLTEACNHFTISKRFEMRGADLLRLGGRQSDHLANALAGITVNADPPDFTFVSIAEVERAVAKSAQFGRVIGDEVGKLGRQLLGSLFLLLDFDVFDLRYEEIDYDEHDRCQNCGDEDGCPGVDLERFHRLSQVNDSA